MRISRRVVVLSFATLFLGYSVGVWNTWTAGLATNGWFVASISVPGLISAFVITKDAVTPSASRTDPSWSPARAFSSDPATIDVDSPIVLAAAGVTVLATIGVTLGMLLGGTADNWRVDLYLSGISHPGRVVAIFGMVVLLVAAVMFFGVEVEAAAWGMLAGALCVVIGFAVGVRTLTGAFPEAEQIGREISDGGSVDPSGLGSVSEAIARDRPPEPEFVETVPAGHIAGVTMTELVSAPDEWRGSVITLEGAIAPEQLTFGRNRSGDSIEAWTLTDDSGGQVRALIWRERGQTVPDTDSPCRGVATVTGQVLAVPDVDGGVLALAAHDWSCAAPRTSSTEQLRGPGDTAVLRRFDRVLSEDDLLTVGRAYRALPGFDGYIVLKSLTGWRDGTTGSAILALPYDGRQPQELCDRLFVSDEGDETCYVTKIEFTGEAVVVLR